MHRTAFVGWLSQLLHLRLWSGNLLVLCNAPLFYSVACAPVPTSGEAMLQTRHKCGAHSGFYSEVASSAISSADAPFMALFLDPCLVGRQELFQQILNAALPLLGFIQVLESDNATLHLN